MNPRRSFIKLEEALCEYARYDQDLPIQFYNLMEQLEGRFGDFNAEDDNSLRAKEFFDTFYAYLFDIRTSTDWFGYWELSLLQFIDTYFQKQIEHHGFHVIGAQEILADPDTRDNPDYWFNAAPPAEIATVEYYQKLLYCQTLWRKVSAEARQEAENLCFPLPLKIA
jgi:hypothetical protein